MLVHLKKVHLQNCFQDLHYYKIDINSEIRFTCIIICWVDICFPRWLRLIINCNIISPISYGVILYSFYNLSNITTINLFHCYIVPTLLVWSKLSSGDGGFWFTCFDEAGLGSPQWIIRIATRIEFQQNS